MYFIPSDIIKNTRPDYPYVKMAWVPGSTPPDIQDKMLEEGFSLPISPDIMEVLSRKPIAAELYLTRTCVLNCFGCSVPDFIKKGKEERAPIEEWKRMLEILALHTKAVKFIGGEVGGLPELPELAKTAVDLGLFTSIFTDGVPFLDDEEKLSTLVDATGGKIVLHTSVDVPPPNGIKNEATDKSRQFKANHGYELMKLAQKYKIPIIGHMMIHQPNAGDVIEIYNAVIDHGGMFSIGTMQKSVHLYQGREPKGFTNALRDEDRKLVQEQMALLIAIEDERLQKGQSRTLANSRAHLATMHTVGIDQNIGCTGEGRSPAVLAIMPDLSPRSCPVVLVPEQEKECPGCSYGVFRDGDPDWAEHLFIKGLYEKPVDREDFPSIFYPTEANNDLTGI